MQAQSAHKCGTLFLETVHTHYLSELDGNQLDTQFHRSSRNTEPHGRCLIRIAADDCTQYLNRLQCVFVVLADLLGYLA